MSSIHVLTAEAHLDRPAYDVAHPAQTFWEEGFELAPHDLAGAGFVASAGADTGGALGGLGAARTGSWCAFGDTKAPGSAAGVATATFTKTLTGLTVGRSYTFSVWAMVPATTAGYTDRARVGVAGIGNSGYVTLSASWQQISYTFTATATSHDLVITGDETDATATGSILYLDDLLVMQNAWTEHFGASSSDVALDVKRSDVTLDEAWSPYAQATLTVVMLPEQYLEFVDPRNSPRITITAYAMTDTGTPTRNLDLSLRRRTVNHKDAEITIKASSDEGLLMDAARVATTSDTSYLAHQANLRNLVNAVLDNTLDATLEADAGATADLTIFSDSTNLVRNPSAETDATTWGAVQCTLTRLASAATGVVGSNCFRLQTPTTDNNCYIYTDVQVTPGETYVFSGNWMLSGATSGSAHALARRLAVSTTAGSVFAQSNAAVSSGDRVSGEVTVPAGVTTLRLRAYHGYTTSGDIRWDAIKFAVKDGSTSDATYFDGATADTASYTYDWTSTTHLSTSTRTDLTGKGLTDDSFTWAPGVSAWDFVHPLVEAAGLRLFCDEYRVWHLVDPSTWTADGTLTLAAADNITDALDTIDRDGDDWYDSVVIKYSWLNKYGVPKVRYDAAGPGGKVLLLEYDRAYPGAGAAAAILARSMAKGRMLDISAISDYLASPAMAFEATLPSTPEQTGVVSKVTWSHPADEMTVKTRS